MTPLPGETADVVLTAERLHRSWRLPLLGLTMVGVSVGIIVAKHSLHPLQPFAYIGVFAGLPLALASAARNSWPRARRVKVRASAESLAIEGEPPVPVDAIAEVKTVTGESGRPEVILTLRSGERRWLRMDTTQAPALIAALGVGARRATFALHSSFGLRLLVCELAATVPWLLSLPGNFDPNFSNLVDETLVRMAATLPLALLAAWVVGLLWRGRLVVGADGFTAHWPLLRPRFTSFRDVNQIDGKTRLIDRFSLISRVRLRSGRVLRLRARETPSNDAQRGAESKALHQCLTEAFARSLDQDPGETQLESLLSRRQRPGSEWLASLDVIGREGGARYRVAAPTTERLVETLQNPLLPSEARAGAAAALLRQGDDDARRVVRVVTDGCAQPDLRRALLDLEQAEDDAAFVAALESLDQPATRRA